MRNSVRHLMIVLALGALAFGSASAFAAKRVALVIGNDTYETLPALNNARTDAKSMASKLRGLGFEVILKLDARSRTMGRALAEFEGKAANAEVALVFYAGHGIQADGKNYLVPSDAQIEVEEDLRYESIPSSDLLQTMKNAGADLNIVILDACRDNPLPKRSRSAARGLTVTPTPAGISGTAIVYSAAPGQTAQDGPKGGNGVFTGALLKVLDRPGLKLEDVFKETAKQVAAVTNGKQKPWINSSLTGDFYFRDGNMNASAPEPSVGGQSAELLFWESIKDSKDAESYQAYLDQYPTGSFAGLARVRLKKLNGELEQTIISILSKNSNKKNLVSSMNDMYSRKKQNPILITNWVDQKIDNIKFTDQILSFDHYTYLHYGIKYLKTGRFRQSKPEQNTTWKGKIEIDLSSKKECDIETFDDGDYLKVWSFGECMSNTSETGTFVYFLDGQANDVKKAMLDLIDGNRKLAVAIKK